MSEICVITPNSTVKQSQGQVSTEIDGEVVLMDIEKGTYFGMNLVLSRIWKLMESSTTVSTICSKLMDEYEVSQEECLKDILECLEQLKKENLIEIA
jgi:hypothetical protein